MKINNIFKESEGRNFGFDFVKDQPVFLVPKQLYQKEWDKPLDMYKKIRFYSQILINYNKKKESEINSKDSLKNLKSLNVIIGYVNLMVDYLEHGEFLLLENYYNKGNKRINWNKTLKSNDVIIQNNSVFYGSMVSKNKRRVLNDEFLYLYKYALAESLSIFKGGSLNNKKENKYSLNQIKHIITKYDDEHFSDRDNYIVLALKSIYFNSDFDKINENKFKTPYHEKFEIIWEHMIEEILPKDKKIKDMKIPKGKYIRFKDNSTTTGADYRLDHIVVSEELKSIHILDSKFYNYYYDGNAPKTESISKQENYKNMIKELTKDKNEYVNYNVNNYFIFPKDNIGENIEYFAKHEISLNDNKKEQIIHCVAINVDKVIELYLNNKFSHSLYKNIINIT
jgi:hypothetical protein